jgi:PhzF family phenazine biosynthesis protein
MPDTTTLARVDARGVIVTAAATGGDYDFVSRFFAPREGIAEDPVTGSAHTVLGPYWAERLGRTVLTGFQASPRGGRVGIEVHGDRVVLSGRAVLMIDGVLSGEATRAMA